jgi:hypothetical protein
MPSFNSTGEPLSQAATISPRRSRSSFSFSFSRSGENEYDYGNENDSIAPFACNSAAARITRANPHRHHFTGRFFQ